MKDKVLPDMQTQLVMHMIKAWCYLFCSCTSIGYMQMKVVMHGSVIYFPFKKLPFYIEDQHQMYIKCHVYYLWSICS